MNTLRHTWIFAIGLIATVAAQAQDDVAARLLAGRYEEAEAAARAALAECVAASADAPACRAGALDALARALVAGGRIAGGEAERTAREALTLAEDRFGAASAPAAASRASLGAALQAQGRAREAAVELEAALSVLGADPQSGVTASDAWGSLSDARIDMADVRGALAAADEALRLARAAEAPEPLRIARLLDRRAEALQVLGDWDTARAALHQALELRAPLDRGHPDSIVTHLLLGDAGWRSGRMSEAGEHFQRAVELAQAALPAAHPLSTRARGRLATWEASQGWFAESLPRHRAALEDARATFGARHPRLADYLNDYGSALVLSGDAPAGVELLKQAVQLLEDVHGRGSPVLGTPLYNLGGAYAEAGEWEAAAEAATRALDLWRRTYGERDARVGLAYKEWADVLAGAGRDADAVPIYEQVVRARVEAGEAAHPATASARVALAQALARLGRASDARRQAELAVEHLARAGWRDREYAQALALLAALALERGGQGERAALALAVESDDLMRAHVRDTVRFLPERLALDYVARRFEGRDAVLTLAAARPGDGRTARVALDQAARSRNLVLDELVARAPQRPATPQAAAAWSSVVSAHERLSQLLYSPDYEHGARLAQARADVDEAERAAALAGAELPRSPEPEGLLVDRIAARLPPRTVLVSFYAYERVQQPRVRAYVAFVLRARERHPQTIPLGAAEPIDDLVARWRAAVAPSGGHSNRRVAQALSLSRSLGRRLWDPLQRALRGARRVLVVPDGSLHQVNFAALRDASLRFVVESGPTLHIVSAERDLLRERPPAASPSVLLVAAPAFDERRALARHPVPHAQAAAWVSAAPVESQARDVWRGRKTACARLGDLKFDPLPESAAEGDDLRALWGRRGDRPVTLLAGTEASEAGFRDAAPEHSILHIATHGFVAEEACDARVEQGRASRVSPLWLSGLVLAGVNQRAAAGPDDDDGILTAEEIGGLDLRHADWVVLSACDTGQGEIRGSEGVLGLRRAFARAGAGTVIMSLWRVADDEARAWMVELYRARSAGGRDTAEAVRAAQTARLRALRDARKPPDPARWAAFVAAGDWR